MTTPNTCIALLVILVSMAICLNPVDFGPAFKLIAVDEAYEWLVPLSSKALNL